MIRNKASFAAFSGNGTTTKKKEEPKKVIDEPKKVEEEPRVDGGGDRGGGVVPTYPTYTSPTAGATWKYNAARPEWNWNQAEPTYNFNGVVPTYSFDQAAPTWQWDDSGRPAAFTYDESTRPRAFEWDDSTRPADFAYDQAAPTYDNAYQERINAMVDQILNRPDFSYDYNADPLYQQYAEAYTRNGNQAMTDTYAQMAARTGGLGSSYAGTASQQVYNQYMQQLNDKIPELYQLAYGMYQDQGNNMRNNLSMLQGLESTDYGRYMDQLGQYNTDRNLAYNVWANGLNQYNTDRNFAYNQWADQVNQWNADRDFAYNMSQDEWNRYYNDRNFSYGQYQDALNQYNNDRNFAMDQYTTALGQYNTDRNYAMDQYQTALNQYNNNRNFDYGVYQDALGQWNTDRNWDYNLWQDNLARQEAAAKAAYNSQVAAYNAANRGSGSGSRSNSGAESQQWMSPASILSNAGIKTYSDALAYLKDNMNYGDSIAKEIAKDYINGLGGGTSKSSGTNYADNAPGATITVPRTSGSGIVEFYGKTYNVSSPSGLQSLIGQINNMPFSESKRKSLMSQLQKLGV